MKIDKRRRLENKTNYKKRLILLKSKSLRLVVRKTNRYIILQIIESKNAMDFVLYSASTKELLKYGWPENKKGSLKSLPAAYLAGYLLGKRTKELKEKIILDSGLIPSTEGSRIYGAVKGISDSGIKINYDEKIIPSKERIKGEDTQLEEGIFKEIMEKIKNKNE